MLPGKSDYFPNDGQPNGRTDGTRGFDLPTDVKSASRKNRFLSERFSDPIMSRAFRHVSRGSRAVLDPVSPLCPFPRESAANIGKSPINLAWDLSQS